MHILSTAHVLAEEATSAAEGSQVSPYVFGAGAFILLTVLLIITLMLKVGD
jgi:hypothetical protein